MSKKGTTKTDEEKRRYSAGRLEINKKDGSGKIEMYFLRRTGESLAEKGDMISFTATSSQCRFARAIYDACVTSQFPRATVKRDYGTEFSRIIPQSNGMHHLADMVFNVAKLMQNRDRAKGRKQNG